MDPTPSAMSTFLNTLGSIITEALTWVGQVGGAILADPVLTFSLGIFALGAAVGIFGRLLSRG